MMARARSPSLGEVPMWSMLALFALIALVLGYVWIRQRRHPVAPGRRPDRDSQVQDKGSFWGGSPGVF